MLLLLSQPASQYSHRQLLCGVGRECLSRTWHFLVLPPACHHHRVVVVVVDSIKIVCIAYINMQMPL